VPDTWTQEHMAAIPREIRVALTVQALLTS
jgi:hypothetical protein